VTDTEFKGRPVTLTWLDPAVAVPVSAVSVVPFTGDGRVVLARLARGVELPGGTVEPADTSPEAAARREVWEEIRVTLGPLVRVQLIRMTAGSRQTHVLVFAGRVTDLPEFVGAHESSGRLVTSCEDFVAHYGFGPAEHRRELIRLAREAVFGTPA